MTKILNKICIVKVIVSVYCNNIMDSLEKIITLNIKKLYSFMLNNHIHDSVSKTRES